MNKKIERRNFIKSAAAGTVGFGILNRPFSILEKMEAGPDKTIGIIGLDTSHSVAFTKALNDPAALPEFKGYRVVAAYPHGSRDIKSSVDRIPGYTEDVKKLGVEITDSIDDLLTRVSAVLLETNDGRLHLEQALPVFRAKKRMFIDKPIAASLEDTLTIFEASKKYGSPLFSASSLRYISGAKEIVEGSLGVVKGADVYSPATIEKTHPDLFWYGVHGVETLFTVMGTGCEQVKRLYTENTDLVTGLWKDDRIGTFRGIRSGGSGYGGTVFGDKGISVLGKYAGYNPLLVRIIEFFETGVPPVREEETVEIFAFMAAAEESKNQQGRTVYIEKVLEKARKAAGKSIY